MKKLMILVLAIALFIPINASAYTTFVAVDQSVVDATDFTAARFLLGLPSEGIILSSLISSGPFNFLDIDGVTNYTYGGSVAPFQGVGDGFTLFPTPPSPASDYDGVLFGGSLTAAGVLFYYQDTTPVGDPTPPVVPTLVFTDATGIWGLTKVFDFQSFTGGLGSGDGAFYTMSQVPVPSAIFLLAPGLLALFGLRRKFR